MRAAVRPGSFQDPAEVRCIGEPFRRTGVEIRRRFARKARILTLRRSQDIDKTF